jgi:uncharacterized protein YggT (Ycf19 family)
MRVLLTIIRLYIVLIFIWTLMTWIPGLRGGVLHNIIGFPIVPVLNLFSFASANVGGTGVGFQAIIVIVLLTMIERWLGKISQEHTHTGYAGDTVNKRHGFEDKGTGYVECERPWYEDLATDEEKEKMKFGKAAPRGEIAKPYRPGVGADAGQESNDTGRDAGGGAGGTNRDAGDAGEAK